MEEEFLEEHNKYRALHGVPPLAIDEKLTDYAQEWANNMADTGTIMERLSIPYGENVFADYPTRPDGQINSKQVVESWYREGRYYRYGVDQPVNANDVRHFTQIVWKETTSLGVGVATDTNGKIYLVCNYEPVGNVEGEFAENVLQVEEKDQPELGNEIGLNDVRPRMQVVRCMERLYAVPSEKLRVWSIWLTKIGEIADEWQRWLRGHIDLTIRLSERLQAAENAISRGKEGDETLVDGVADEADDVTVDGEAEDDVDDESVGTVASKTTVSEIPVKEEEGDTEEPEVIEIPEDQMMTVDSSKRYVLAPGWPLGTPWRPTGPEKEPEREPFDIHDIPRTEEEMTEYLKSFTRQATIYRSYYKHWKETADQAIKEVGGRTVMCTVKVQGRYDMRRMKSLSFQARYGSLSSTRSRRTPMASSSHVVKDSGISDATLTQSRVNVGQEIADDDNDDWEGEEGDDDDDDDMVMMAQSKSDTPTVIEVSAGSLKSRTNTVSLTDPSEISEQKKIECDEVPRRFRDEARADEDVPYFFFVKTEPDIDVAIEHDDDHVIAADPDSESIAANYKRLYFNLADKPGKGGKPWL